MDSQTRRALLSTGSNPQPSLDYVVTLEGQLGDHRLVVRYVPDRTILRPESLVAYLPKVSDRELPLEELAVLVLGDLVDALVARWTHVTLIAAPGALGRHEVMLEDRQPKWDNPALLGRLKKH